MKKYAIEEIIRMLKEAHEDVVSIDIFTYKGIGSTCRFVDIEFGEFWNNPSNVIRRKQGHPARSAQKRKQTNLKKYGVACSLASPEIQEKVRKTNLEKYGNIIPAKTIGIQEKTRQTNLKKYGVENPMQNEEIHKKAEDPCIKKFGVPNPMQNKDIVNKTIQTNLEKYGSISPLQNKDVREKTRQTNLQKYGVEYPAQNPEIYEKVKQTNLDRYGAECSMQNHEVALKNAQAQNNTTILIHWFSHEEIVCTASYEVAAVIYFNANHIDYNWQPQTFTMPDGRTYRPDCYLPDLDIWIEIKGYFRDDAEEKWNWFHKEHPNSELWNEEKLKEMNLI